MKKTHYHNHITAEFQKTIMKNHILIVDDEEEARNLLEHALRNEGYQLSFAKHGEQGLAMAQQLLPDTIITDLMMPVMNGLELCKHLRKDSQLSAIPILMLTSMTDRTSRLQGIEAGADDFLAKPCDRTELRTRLRTITRLNRYRRLMNEQLKFQWAIEQAQEGYVLLNEQGIIEYANASAREFLHLPNIDKKSTLSIPPVQFLSHVKNNYECQPEHLWEHWPPSLDNAASIYLVRPETRQSSALWIDVRAFHSPDKSEVLVHLRDVSKQVSLHRRTCTFEALISHKLLSPLGAMSILPLLKSKLENKISDDLMEFLDLAIENSNKLQQQVQEIINYVETLDSVGLVQAAQYTSVQQLVHLFENEAKKQELKAKLNVSPNMLSLKVGLSISDLYTVFSNILNNAKKFHPKQQPLVILQTEQYNLDKLTFYLIDDGIRLPIEELDKVWQPYYQNEKSFTGEVQGMGLGLSRVAAIVWSVGGHCSLSNREDKPGIKVKINLPILH